jgi:hypothetical protein
MAKGKKRRARPRVDRDRIAPREAASATSCRRAPAGGPPRALTADARRGRAAAAGHRRRRLPRVRDRRRQRRAGGERPRRAFEERTPPAPIIDLEVDPSDPRDWIGSTAEGVIASEDEGRTWRQREPIPNSRFAWPERDALYRIDPGGPVKFSADGGRRWEDRGSTGGEPQAMYADGPEHLFVALIDGTVKESRDGGRTWTDRVTPPAA